MHPHSNQRRARAALVDTQAGGDGLTFPQDNGVRVIEKAVRLLRTLASYSHPATLATLARDSGMPKTTVHRLIRTLEAQNVVRRSDAGYEITPDAFSEPRIYADIRDQLLPVLLHVYERTHLLVQLMVLEGRLVRCVEQLHAAGDDPPVLGRGTTWLAHETAAGKLLLALRELPKGTLMPDPSFAGAWGRSAASAWDRELVQVRRAGIAFDRRESRPRLMSAAAPVNTENGTVAAISVTGPAHTVTETATSVALRSAVHLARAALQGSARSAA
jgi:DNA-binding IclR family transcriptional regulator